jgi:hypothetical protein
MLSALATCSRVKNVIVLPICINNFSSPNSSAASCSWLSKKIVFAFLDQNSVLGWIAYFICVCLLWPLCVLVISIPLGQFTFFKNYVGKIFKRFRS